MTFKITQYRPDFVEPKNWPEAFLDESEIINLLATKWKCSHQDVDVFVKEGLFELARRMQIPIIIVECGRTFDVWIKK